MVKGPANDTMPFRFVYMKNKPTAIILFHFGAMLSKQNEIVIVESAQTHR